jgi:hypothetical protein
MALRQGLASLRGGAGSVLSGLYCSPAGVSASSSAGAASSCGAPASGWHAWGMLRKRCFSAQGGGKGDNGKSLLDGAMAGHSASMGAAEQRAATIKATSDAGVGDGHPSIVRQALRLIGRGVLIGGGWSRGGQREIQTPDLGAPCTHGATVPCAGCPGLPCTGACPTHHAGGITAVASGYATWAYETRDLHVQLKAFKAAEAAGTPPPLWLPVMEYYLGWRDSIEVRRSGACANTHTHT